MTCSACSAAEQNPLCGGIFFAACIGCQARSIAMSPTAFAALAGDADAKDQLRAMIEKVWKDDYAGGRRAVWDWMQRIKAWKASQQVK